MAAELPLQANFLAFAVPGAIAAIAMTVFSLRERARLRQPTSVSHTRAAAIG